MTRTTEDVIKDLDNAVTEEDAKCGWSQIALVIGFEHECEMIFHDDRDRLNRLNIMIRKGGCPIGFIKTYRIGKGVSILTKLFPEFENDKAANKCLQELSIVTGKKIAFGNEST